MRVSNKRMHFFLSREKQGIINEDETRCIDEMGIE